ncbi:MAG: transglutaminase-like domain-containing protein [Acidobacteriota bacterium]
MNKKKIVISFPFILLLSLAALGGGGDDTAPGWLQEDSHLKVPSYDVKALPAVILRKEESITIDSNGTVTRTERGAVRFLLHEGRGEALARAVYETDSAKVRDINAWLIKASGQVKSFGKKETLDIALAPNDLYNEARLKLIDATESADVGDVFGYETVTEQKSVFSQFEFDFQENLPVIFSSFNLNLPTGWKAESVTFNRANVEPSVNGASYTWQLRDLNPIDPEPSSPSPASLSPRLAVSFYPAVATTTSLRTFADWNAVARWMAELEDPQMTVDDALAGKARDLTANSKTELEKIKAIARYVQQTQYISIQIGLGRGGGYVPHSATEVFAKSYGDCKDKANLMRAMLSALKISAYMVSITADDPTYVRAEWASPGQFNHCIVAIKVGDETTAASVVVHPKLGRLLIFDPTDPYTQVGDLPREEQGSFALIDHKDTDSLLKMPVTPPEMNKLERTVELTLSPDGAIAGSINERSIGQSAALERARFRRLSSPDYNAMIDNWISRGASGAKTTKVAPNDDSSNGIFNLAVEFSANGYAQIMQDHLMVFKPAVIGRLDNLSFSEGKRMNPYVIESRSYSEQVKIKLPLGFTVDEVPDATQLETAFGKYIASYEVKGEFLIFSRDLKLNRTTVPADNYDSIRRFFGTVHAAEQSPVVLIKK